VKPGPRAIFLAGTVLRVCLGVAFAVSLIHPATREVQVLCARLLFRFLPLGGNIYVWDQSKYEWLHELPRASFTDSFRAEALANAGRSADDFVLALSLAGYADFALDPPPPGVLEDHPLLPWVAMEYTEKAASRDHRPRGHPARQLPEGKVSEMLLRAQRAHPSNGALWLAEGVFHLEAGREAEGLNALRTAVEKGGWDGQTASAFLHRFRLFVANGLPQREAATDAAFGCSASRQLVLRLKGCLESQMTQAIASHDDARFNALLGVLTQLALPVWGTEDRIPPHILCICRLDLGSAMFARLKQEFPDQWRPDPTDYMATEDSFDAHAVRGAYLAAYAEPETVLGSASACAAASRAAENTVPARDNSDRHWAASCEAGRLALLFQALIIAVLILHLPSRFFDPASLLRGWLPRNAGFWIATGAALALAIALLTTAFVATTPIASYQFGLVWDSLLLAIGVSGVWTVCKVCWLVEHPAFRVVPMTAVALGFAYLAAVSAVACFRADLLRAILATFSA